MRYLSKKRFSIFRRMGSLTIRPYELSQILIPQVWLNVADTTSFTLSGTNVTGMTDRSPNAYAFTVPYGNPTYNSSIQGIRFQSTNQFFQFPAAAVNNASTYMFVFVARFGNLSQYLMAKQADFVNSFQVFGIGRYNNATGTNGNLYFNVSNGTTLANSGATGIQTNIPYIIVAYFDGVNFIFRVNGAQLASTPAGNFTLADYIGGLPSFGNWAFSNSGVGLSTNDWTFHEFIYTARFPGIQSIFRIEAYLASKWGLTQSMSTQNPIFTMSLSLVLNNVMPIPRRGTFRYTGADQTYVVPSGVTSLFVYLWGAGGGGALAGAGGAGAMVQGVLSVTPGETLTIIVGQAGDGLNRNEAGRTYGGGGTGGAGDALFNSRGGGRSAIRRSGADIVTVGAGGGGRGVTGGRGGLATGFAPSSGTATGGTQSAGGNTGGALNLGGNSVADNNGGGGSGYYGGGGGPSQDQPGAGGSSLTANLSLIPGETVFGFVSTDGNSAPNTTSPYYSSGVGFGGVAGTGSVRGGTGGNGLVVLFPNPLVFIIPNTITFVPYPVAVASQVRVNYSGTYTSVVVPAGANFMLVNMWGAGGGLVFDNTWWGGGGAYIEGYLPVTPGETLRLIVGAAGSRSVQGDVNGGPGVGSAAYGGGRTAVQRSIASVFTDVAVAGAGGGAGGGGTGNPGGGGAATASGIAFVGRSGNLNFLRQTANNGVAGGGGGQSSGGTGGNGNAAANGSKGQGGSSINNYSSGGGGGWYGGGGGIQNPNDHGSGGGGSSYGDLLVRFVGFDANANFAGNRSSRLWVSPAGNGSTGGGAGDGLLYYQFYATI